MQTDTALVESLRLDARRLRQHAKMIEASFLGYLWLTIRWHKKKRLWELRYFADVLTSAANRIEQLTKADRQ